jgi:hypothetical protein
MNDKDHQPADQRPFLLQYSELVHTTNTPEIGYDLERQLVRINISGAWQDAADCRDDHLWHMTRETRASRETTDDE